MPPRGYGFNRAYRDAPETKPHVGSTYLRLLQYARPYWPRVLLILLISIATALTSTLPPQVVGVAVDRVRAVSTEGEAQPRPTRAEAAPAIRLPMTAPIEHLTSWAEQRGLQRVPPAALPFAVMAAMFLFLHLLGSLVGIAHSLLMAHVGQRLILDMRGQLYGHLQRLSLSYYENQRTGDTMSRVVNDVNSLEQVIVGPIVHLITDICRLGWILFFLLRWDAQLTVYALLIGPVLVAVTFSFGKVLRKNFRKLRTRIGDLNTIANDNISGIRVIKIFSREAHEEKRFGQRNRAVYKQNLKLAAIFACFRPTVQILTNTGSAIVLCYGGYKVVQGTMNVGTFVVFFPYLAMLYRPITGLTRFWAFLQRAIASVERVFEVLDTSPGIQDKPDAIDIGTVKGHVSFDDVSFAYADGPDVLSHINLTAQPGQMIAFVGPSGAGKSTVISLIPRFYDAKDGRITVDGQDVRDMQLASLRRNMTMVLQESFLFNDTVRANIAYGKIGAGEAEIEAAACAANAHEFIAELPKGYDTVVGERGIKLSGGQKQRLSIARAVLANPRILILDEATSSVDTEAESLIQTAIDNLASNRTTFVIAHRLSTVQHADQILVIDAGRILEQGNHAQLLERSGLYRRLYDMQFRNDTSPSHRPTPTPPTPHIPEGDWGNLE